MKIEPIQSYDEQLHYIGLFHFEILQSRKIYESKKEVGLCLRNVK